MDCIHGHRGSANSQSAGPDCHNPQWILHRSKLPGINCHSNGWFRLEGSNIPSVYTDGGQDKKKSVALVGDDTDLLVLLLHHFKLMNHSIFLQTTYKILDVWILPNHLGPTTLVFLVIHPWSDMTLRLYDTRKVLPKPYSGNVSGEMLVNITVM